MDLGATFWGPDQEEVPRLHETDRGRSVRGRENLISRCKE